jgi:hypothetical protein
MDNVELTSKRQWYEQQLANIRELVQGWNTAVERGFIDGQSLDPEISALAWRPTPQEERRMNEFAAIGRKYLEELNAVEVELGIIRDPNPPARR